MSFPLYAVVAVPFVPQDNANCVDDCMLLLYLAVVIVVGDVAV